MMWFFILLFIISVLVNITLVYCLFNTLRKLEQYEEWVDFFREEIGRVQNRLKSIDDRQMFEKDDDVGFLFQELIRIIKEFDETIK